LSQAKNFVVDDLCVEILLDPLDACALELVEVIN
jgi:hypothetical protein